MAHATLPHTLTANTLAQASQVMANLQAIVTQVNGNLDATNLKDGAVTEGKLGAASVNTTALASGAITNDKMSADSVDTAQVKDAAITNAKMAADSVDTTQVKDAAVTNAKMATGSVDTDQLVDGAVTNAKLASDLDASKLTTGTLPSERIGSKSIAGSQLADGTVDTGQLKDDAVTEDKIANAAVTPAKTSFFTGGALYAGRVNSDGTAGKLPSGWTCVRQVTGSYLITHNLGTTAYVVVVSPQIVTGGRSAAVTRQENTFQIATYKLDGTLVDSDCYFVLVKD